MNNLIARVFFLVLLTLTLPCGAQIASALFQITGHGNTGPGGYDLTLSALFTTNGPSGFVSLAGGVTGPVIQVVPPGDACDCWCINVKRTDTLPVDGDQRANVYIRDIGDGIISFDRIGFISSIGRDCDDFPRFEGGIPLVRGNFLAVFLDSDGDGVPDYQDNCPDTPANEPVNDAGCSINQIVPCAGPQPGVRWKNHGQYLGALRLVADSFLALGLVTSSERDSVVRAAARSDCGKK